jgi:NAD(P) transhydrogenase subunit beta
MLAMAMLTVPANASTGAEVPSWVGLAYLIAGVCFILALRGLSHPSTSQRGNRAGMAGMLIAVVTTLLTLDIANLPEIAAAIVVGGAIGWIIARRIAMTDMPQLVAAFHSLVGLAAVLVGWAAYLNPQAFGILEPLDQIDLAGLLWASKSTPSAASNSASASRLERSPSAGRLSRS